MSRKLLMAAGDASALGHAFANGDLLRLALTHSSWANEHGAGREHNERLEFLGDAVLELCVSQKLFCAIPGAREGELTRLRSELVSTESLARRAREQGLDKRLLLGRGEERQGGRERDTVLSDVFEAVLGAVFSDGGFSAAQRAVEHVFAGLWPHWEGEAPRRKDFKTLLQEECQHTFGALPTYALLESSGPEHAPLFRVSVTLPDGRVFEAEGSGRKRAEHEAARKALALLRGLPDGDAGAGGGGSPAAHGEPPEGSFPG